MPIVPGGVPAEAPADAAPQQSLADGRRGGAVSPPPKRVRGPPPEQDRGRCDDDDESSEEEYVDTYGSMPSRTKRAWREVFPGSRDLIDWCGRVARARHSPGGTRLALPPDLTSLPSPSGTHHPPGCQCNSATCPVPFELRVGCMRIV